MTGKYHFGLKTFLKIFLVTGMAVVIPGGCSDGDSGGEAPKSNPVAPRITVLVSNTNVFGGAKVEQADSSLLIGGEKVAEWKAGSGRIKSVVLAFNDSTISFGTLLSKKGTLSLTVTNDADKSASSKVTLTDEAIMGLGNVAMQVGVEVNLLENLSFAKGVELTKTEIEFDGQRTEITDPMHFTPEYPGLCNLFFSVKKNEIVSEVKADNLTIKPLDYQSMEVNNIKPVDILPIIGQIKGGDRKVYEHIEHLRVAEATRIIDMMREYGAGNHSAEDYKQLMNRLNTGMALETPIGYNNYEIIGGVDVQDSSIHAQVLRSILNTLINHANLKVVNPRSGEGVRMDLLFQYINNQNTINIFGNATSSDFYNKAEYDAISNIWEKTRFRDLCNSENFILFTAGTNISNPGGITKNKIYNGEYEYECDEHGIYSIPSSLSNSDKNTQPNTHLLVTIGTNANGDIDQTGVTIESSKFPVGFANNVLFSGRGFPVNETGAIVGLSGRYTTSPTTYLNVALADLCFQMKADVNNVDELLEMIRSTCLTDYIRLDLNGDGDTNDNVDGQPETQPLQLINPGGIFLKYLMPTELPTSINWSQTAELSKGYYHGLGFDIPGAEVNINGEWISFSAENKDLILAQNPFALEWRLNGDLLHKLGYKQGDTITGRIIAVDDQWNGLSLSQDISINVSASDAINAPHVEATSDTKLFYLNDQRVGKDYKGIVISNGRKTITK